jgi:hypothetical protein
MNGIEAVEIIVEATQEQLHILDEVAQYVETPDRVEECLDQNLRNVTPVKLRA